MQTDNETDTSIRMRQYLQQVAHKHGLQSWEIPQVWTMYLMDVNVNVEVHMDVDVDITGSVGGF